MNEKEMASDLTQFLKQKSKVKAESETEHYTGNGLIKGEENQKLNYMVVINHNTQKNLNMQVLDVNR